MQVVYETIWTLLLLDSLSVPSSCILFFSLMFCNEICLFNFHQVQLQRPKFTDYLLFNVVVCTTLSHLPFCPVFVTPPLSTQLLLRYIFTTNTAQALKVDIRLWVLYLYFRRSPNLISSFVSRPKILSDSSISRNLHPVSSFSVI